MKYHSCKNPSVKNDQTRDRIQTERLIIRKFTDNDVEALFRIFSDEELNTFLPWYPLKSMAEAVDLLNNRYLNANSLYDGAGFAVCLKEDDVPIGYVNVSGDDSHDLGYGLLAQYRKKGYMREAVSAVISLAKKEGIKYLTATHDVNNPKSGEVMKAVGMEYKYSYVERWLPKDFDVTYRMYQIDLAGDCVGTYMKYWDKYSRHFIEKEI